MKTLKLKSKKYIKPERVYDLEIKDNHNFFANNISVHNCYQEQYMQIAQRIGGFTDYEINKLRKDLTKGGKRYNEDPEVRKKIDNHKKKFIKHATEYIGENEATKLFDFIFSFSAYGFNQSHSVSYTYISYYEAWLKFHYMPEFYTALLNNTDPKKVKKGENVIAQYLTEAMKKGFNIHIPNVNTSSSKFTIKGNKDSEERFDIIFGLSWIKNLATDSIRRIVEERKNNGIYSSIDDFFERQDKLKGRKINKKDIDALIWSGAFDCFFNEIYEDRFDLHEYVYETIKGDKKYSPLKKSEDLLIEKEYESINISMKEMAQFTAIKKKLEDERSLDVTPLVQPEEEQGNFLCVGKVTKLENKVTKTGKDYVRINLRDETNELRMIYAWPWKCKDWDKIKYGQTIIAHVLHDDSGFKNLTGWSLVVKRSQTLIEAEKEARDKMEKEAKEKEEKNKSLEQTAKKRIMDVVKTLKSKYKLNLNVNKEFNRINASMEIESDIMNKNTKILAFYYTSRKGFTVKDLRAFRGNYDYLYIVRNDEEDVNGWYLYKTKDFASSLRLAPKDGEGLRYPILNKEETLTEDILFNVLDNKA